MYVSDGTGSVVFACVIAAGEGVVVFGHAVSSTESPHSAVKALASLLLGAVICTGCAWLIQMSVSFSVFNGLTVACVTTLIPSRRLSRAAAMVCKGHLAKKKYRLGVAWYSSIMITFGFVIVLRCWFWESNAAWLVFETFYGIGILAAVWGAAFLLYAVSSSALKEFRYLFWRD